MDELNDEDSKDTIKMISEEEQECSQLVIKSEPHFTSDDDNCHSPKRSIFEQKMKKQKTKKEHNIVYKDKNTNKKIHEKDINQISKFNEMFNKTNESTTKKSRKKDKLKHVKVKNLENVSNYKEKKKNKKNDIKELTNTDNNSMISNNNLNCDKKSDETTVRDSESEELNFTNNNELKQSEHLALKITSPKKKKIKLEDCSDEAEINKLEAEITSRDTDVKAKKNRENIKETKNNSKLNDSKQSSANNSVIEYKSEQNISVKQEILDNTSESDYSFNEEDDIDKLSFIPRVKKPKLNFVELKASKIVEYDKGDTDDDEIHPLQQHQTLSHENALKLSAIRIELTHEVPPQHDIEKLAGTRVPTKYEKNEIKKYVEIKRGVFDCAEDKKIVHNWKKFCKKYDWDVNLVEPFLHVKHKGFFYVSPVSERRKFVQLLANGLPNRTLYSVYHRFRNIYSNHKQDRYSKEEDEELLRSIKKNLSQGEKPNYAILAKKFNRTRASVWRRYVLLMKK